MDKENEELNKDIGVILKVLYALRNDGRFYFDSYGADMIKSAVKEYVSLGSVSCSYSPLLFLYSGKGAGIKPTIQDFGYWVKGGYNYIAYESDGAVTLSKTKVKLDNHAAFHPQNYR